jgi:hypothetical protein
LLGGGGQGPTWTVSRSAALQVEVQCIAIGSNAGALAERRNGRKWAAQATAPGIEFLAASCTSAWACTAVGFRTTERWVGKVINKRKAGKHFITDIAAGRFTYRRDEGRSPPRPPSTGST